MKLEVGKHIHLMGICGTAMASLAGLLKGMGYKVTGSDQNVYPPMSTQLEELGIPIMEGYKKENLNPAPDLVIVGNVISKTHEEAAALLESQIPYTSLPKAMGEYLIQNRNSIVVAGTHGKTTTTSIMSWVAETCGIEAGFMIGGIPQNYSHSFRQGKDNWFVIEGDEYDTAFFDKVPKFIHYKPKYVILTSMEFDHADIYNSFDDVKAAFYQLIQLIPKDGILVANADDPNVVEILGEAQCPVVTYGLHRGDYRAQSREVVMGRNQFSVVKDGQSVGDIAAKVFGPHNTLNLLAVFALSIELGWKPYQILQGLASFKGVKRRQELLGDLNGAPLIEDFAHHPTAVSLTLDMLKEQYGDRKIIAVFEPRSATSRRNVFQDDYAKAFKKADRVYLSRPYDQSKIPEGERFSSDQLVNDLKSHGTKAEVFEGVDEIVAALKKKADKKSVVVIMSNGGFDGIYQKVLKN